MSLFDHIAFQSNNLRRSLSFYESCMPKLGLAVISHSDRGFFVSGGERAPVPFIWIHSRQKGEADKPGGKPGNYLHLMFIANSRADVEAFHHAALKGGGSESGAPGYQGPEEVGYYAALVFDSDGNTLEAGFRKRVR